VHHSNYCQWQIHWETLVGETEYSKRIFLKTVHSTLPSLGVGKLSSNSCNYMD